MAFVEYFIHKGEGKIEPISMKELKLTPKLTNPGAMYGGAYGIYVLNMNDETLTWEEIEKIQESIDNLKKRGR